MNSAERRAINRIMHKGRTKLLGGKQNADSLRNLAAAQRKAHELSVSHHTEYRKPVSACPPDF
jgi:hypothetical protein